MADDKLIIQIGGDTVDFKESLDSLIKDTEKWAKESEKIFSNSFKESEKESKKSLTDIAAGFFLAREAVNLAGKAVEKFKELIIDSAIEGERLKKLNSTFDIFASQVGLAGEALREDIIRSIDGLIASSEAITVASQSVLKLEKNASRIPEIFELSTKIAKTFGEDATTVFERISNAVASGSAKQLRSIGIVIDTDKVYKDFAKSLGITVDLLNQEQRQFALLDAALSKGRTSFASVNAASDSLGTSYKQLTASIKELNDSASVSANKIFGNIISNAFKNLTESVKDFNLTLKNATGTAGIDDQLKFLIQRREENNRFIRESAATSPGLVQVYELQNKKLQQQIDLLQERIDKGNEAQFQRALRTGNLGAESQAPGLTPEQIRARDEARLKSEIDFQSKLIGIKQQELAAEQSIAQQIRDEQQKNDELDRIAREQIALEIQQSNINKDAIRLQAAQNELITLQQKNALIEAEEKRSKDAIQNIEDQAAARRTASIQAANKIIQQALAGGLSNTIQKTIGAIKNGENAIKAFASSILETFGDLAIQLGQFYIAQGLANLALLKANPGAQIATGAALVALGSIIKSFFASQGASADAASVGSSTASIPDAQIPDAAGDIQDQTTNVKIDVQGTVLDPIGVGRQIAQILNETFDATGTRVVTT